MKNNEWVRMVADFTRANGYTVPNRLINPMPHHTKVLRLRLMMEELGELSCAMHENNVIEIADGLTDLLYVVIGTAVEYGLGPILYELFDEVHASNMSKDYAERPDGRKGGVKGPKYFKPRIALILREYEGLDNV